MIQTVKQMNNLKNSFQDITNNPKVRGSIITNNLNCCQTRLNLTILSEHECKPFQMTRECAVINSCSLLKSNVL